MTRDKPTTLFGARTSKRSKGARLNLPTLMKVLEEKIGTPLGVASFDERLRLQKAMYLLGSMSHPGARRYRFSMYVHGPYSPELAKDYYALQDGKPLPAVVLPDGPRDREAETLVAEAIQRGNKFLEAAATLHKVRRENPGADAAVVKGHVLRLKPHVADRIEEAWQFLTANRLIAAST